MSAQEAFEILNELVKIEDFMTFEEVSSNPFHEIEKQALGIMPPEKAKEFTKKIDNFRNRLVSALLKLSPDEANEFIYDFCEGSPEPLATYYQEILSYLVYSDSLFYEQRFAIAEILGHDDIIQNTLKRNIETLTTLDKMKSSGQSYFFQNLHDSDVVNRELVATSILIFRNLLDLFNNEIIDEKLIAQILNYSRYKKGDLEIINNSFAKLIQEQDNPDNLEKIAATWNKLLPNNAAQRLKSIFLETTNPQVKKILGRHWS
jgi:hypothetical protein